MIQLASVRNVTLLFTHVSAADEQHLRQEILTAADGDTWRLLPDLDHGVEWCEEQLLDDHTAWGKTEQDAVAQLADLLSNQHLNETLKPDRAKIESCSASSLKLRDAFRLLACMERRELEPGETVIRQGEAPQGITFIESGQLTAQLDLPGGRVVRLRTMQPGVFIGELSVYSGMAASASVVVDRSSVVYHLSSKALNRLTEAEPELAAAFHRLIAQLVSERLLSATSTLGSLMR